MRDLKTQRRLEKFVRECKANDDPAIVAVGAQNGCFIRNVGALEYQLLLLANLIYAFRKQAGDQWDELKTMLFNVVDDMHEADK